MGKNGGKREGAGRPPGSLNQVTIKKLDEKRAIEVIAREHGQKAIDVLVDMMEQGKPDSVKVSAATTLLERGYGRAPAYLEVGQEAGARLHSSGLSA
jgi:hypothetical protein